MGVPPGLHCVICLRDALEAAMAAVLSQPLFSYADYLAWEASAPVRHEYLDGEVFAMTGTTTTHNVISGNVYLSLRQQIRGTPCRVYMADVRLRVAAANAGFYPDVFVTCSAADAARHNEQEDALMVVEVLSPSTEGRDRGAKFAAYRQLPTLHAVVFIAQDEPLVEAYTRGAAGVWTLHEARGLSATLSVQAGERAFALPLAEVYADVDFAAAKADAVAAAISGTSA